MDVRLNIFIKLQKTITITLRGTTFDFKFHLKLCFTDFTEIMHYAHCMKLGLIMYKLILYYNINKH